MTEYTHAVFIGRLQPFHNSHLKAVKKCLEVAGEAIILVGSAYSARNIKNPWTFNERELMIRGSLTKAENARVHIRPIRDYFYNDNIWCAQVQRTVSEITNSPQICLIGGYKDGSSYYLNMFPQWDFIATDADRLNATEIRDDLFSAKHQDVIHAIPKGTDTVISTWMQGSHYNDLKEEYKFINDYKSKWKDAPFAPTFVTTDAVVVQSGHVLLVKRKFNPGKGLYALPGGFLRGNERVEDGMLRELKEETGIKVHKLELRKAIKDTKVFDYPGRSLRGRTITHASLIMLEGGDLPEVKGQDDAESAFWMSIADVYKYPESFYEDHFSIIDALLMKGK